MRTFIVLAWLGVAAGANAQSLPSEPITFGGGRVIIGGELTATVAPEDPGFFNYTDYEYSALRNLRAAVVTEVRAHPRLQFLSEIRMDRGNPFEAYGLYARIRPWLSRRVDVLVGRVPPTFGSFGRGGYSNRNILIGYPLSYQYLTSLRSDALPASPNELLGMRGRGWRTRYSVGDPYEGPGLPIVNGFHWDTGVQVRGEAGIVEWTGSVTTGSLSTPRVKDDNDGRQLAGRVVLNLTPGLAVGGSAARGAFMSRTVQPALPEGADVEDAVQRGLGIDAEYSIGRFLGRGEVMWSRWTLPEPFWGGPLKATSMLGEARYRLFPGFQIAGRAEHLGFSQITGSRRDHWEAPVKRFEAGVGWAMVRNVVVKVSWQRNLRNAGRVRRESLSAAQLVYWF
jgi:hypothetical protein